MKKYYIKYPRNFGNEYDLIFTTTPEEDQRAIDQGYERIAKKQAISKCVAERWARKNDPAFSGYGSVIILPLDFERGEYDARYMLKTTDGYVYE